MNLRHSLVILSVAVVIAACKKSHPPTDLTKENLIPIPVSVQATAMVFEVTNETQIYVEGPDLLKVGQYLAEKLRPATGYEFKVSETTGEPRSGNIYITTEETIRRIIADCAR